MHELDHRSIAPGVFQTMRRHRSSLLGTTIHGITSHGCRAGGVFRRHVTHLSTAAPAGLSVTRMGRRWEPSSSRSDDARRLPLVELLTCGGA